MSPSPLLDTRSSAIRAQHSDSSIPGPKSQASCYGHAHVGLAPECSLHRPHPPSAPVRLTSSPSLWPGQEAAKMPMS